MTATAPEDDYDIGGRRQEKRDAAGRFIAETLRQPVVRRVAVRAKSQGLVAYQVDAPADLLLVDGRTIHAQAGDYIVTRGSHTLDVLSPQRFGQGYELVDTGLVLTRAECSRLEETLGIGATTAGMTLAQAVERLALLAIGEVRLEFTPGQLSELKHRATKRGQTIEQAIKNVVDRIRDELFHQGG